MYLGDFTNGATVRIHFTTTDGNGAPVAPSSAFAAADFRIYKDGSATEKTTTNGITVTSPFDSVVGSHLIEIDTSNNTGDSGFFAIGSDYRVEINSAKTVDSQSQSGVVVGRFSLQNRFMRGTDNALTDKTGYSLSTAGNEAVRDAIDPSLGLITSALSNLTMEIISLETAVGNIDIDLTPILAAIEQVRQKIPPKKGAY